jgi:hypothetical protein
MSKHSPDERKADVINRIEVEHRRLEKNLMSISEDNLQKPGVNGDWSVKDVLAHLTDWEERFLGWYEAGLRGEVPETPAPGLSWSWGNLDILNRQVFEKHRHSSLEDVQTAFEKSYQRTLEVVRSIPAEDMIQPRRYAWTKNETLMAYIVANTCNHYRWAKTIIRRWMKSEGMV